MVMYFYVLVFVMVVFVKTALPGFRYQNFEKFGKNWESVKQSLVTITVW
jgi:hypothetical protein